MKTKQTTPWFGMPLMTSGHEMQQALFLQLIDSCCRLSWLTDK